MDKRVLILGGSYFIGKKIAAVLLQNDYKVSVLNRGTKPCAAGIEQIICDRSDEDGMRSVLKGRQFDYVIDVSWLDVSWVKILCGSLNFDSVKSIIFISSSSVYDIENITPPIRETDKLARNKYWTSYGENKIEAEKYYKEFLDSKSASLIILRPPYVYGEDNYAQRESFIFKHICGGDPIIIPHRIFKLQFIYTADLAKIVMTLIDQTNDKLAIYNIGNKITPTAREWVEACAAVVGRHVDIIECDYETHQRKVRDFFPFFDYNNVLDVEKINKIISDETPLIEGLKIAYRWYDENKSSITFRPNVEKSFYDIIAEYNV